MPRITDMISLLEVGGKRYNTPEWWNSQHKLTRVAKQNKAELLASIKANASFNSSYCALDCDDIPVDTYISTARAKLDTCEYEELAPWNSVFHNKFKTIILFKH